MTDDFKFYQGDDIIPYFVITDGTDPVDLSGWTAATWVATPSGTTTPTILKHKSDMTLDVDPEAVEPTIENCIFVPIIPGDTGLAGDVGQFRHELRITLDDLEAVVYPVVGTTATFSVIESLTWDPGDTPPAPRLPRPEPAPQVEKVETTTLKRMPRPRPRLPAQKKVG